MPINEHEMENMKDEYGKKKGEEVYYATECHGKCAKEPSIHSILHKMGILSKEEKEENEKKEKYANTFTKEKLGKAWKASKALSAPPAVEEKKWASLSFKEQTRALKETGSNESEAGMTLAEIGGSTADVLMSWMRQMKKESPIHGSTLAFLANTNLVTGKPQKMGKAELSSEGSKLKQLWESSTPPQEIAKKMGYSSTDEVYAKVMYLKDNGLMKSDLGKMGAGEMPADQKKSIDPKLNAYDTKMAKGLHAGDWVVHRMTGKEGEVKDQSPDGDLLVAWDGYPPNKTDKVKQSDLEYQEKDKLFKARADWKAYRAGKAASQEEKDKEKKEHPELPKKDTDQIAEDHDKLGKDNCMVCGTKTPGNLCPKCMKKPVGEMGKAMMPTWIEDEILAAVTKFNDEQKALSYVLRQSNVQEAIVDGYTNENDIKKQLKQELAFNKKEAAHEKRIEHGDCSEKKFAQHSLQPKDYATMEAKFLKEGDYHEKGGLLCKYSWDVLNACKDTFKGKAFYIEHANEKLGSEYGTIDEVEARTIDGENWLVARMKVPETDFTKGILDRIENGLIKNVSSAHELFVDLAEPGNRVRRMSGRAISLVKEGEVPGAEIMNIKRHAAG